MGACSVFPEGYRPRRPKAAPLHRLLSTRYDDFRTVYNERFSKRYGYWRPVTEEVVLRYLDCGILGMGFARIRCEECGAEYLRAFSCKCRGFCPSCTKRKSLDLAAFLEEELLEPVPHRHWVWSLPKLLRLHFLHHRRLLPRLCGCAWKSVTTFLHEATGRRDLFPGGVLVPQTFGGLANWNPHVHGLLTDTCRDREGNTFPSPPITNQDLKGIEKVFRSLVLQMLLKEEKLSPYLAEKMRSWKHSGFSVYRGEPVEDEEGRRTLAEYLSRAPFSLERMTVTEEGGSVIYRGERFHPGLGRNFEITDPLEWIARITAHIPRKGSKQVIYYGSYSQAWRGRERRQGILPATDQELPVNTEGLPSCSRRRRCMWAILLKKVWDIDALKCPMCGGRMKAISVIERPSVIRRILKHLSLYEEEKPRSPPDSLQMVCEPYADYVPWRDDVSEIEVG